MKAVSLWILFLGLAALTIWGWWPKPKFQKPIVVNRPELIIQDNHAARWIPIDNSFTTAASRWSGILIQLGEFYKYKESGEIDDSWPIGLHLKSIKFEGINGTYELYPTDTHNIPFGWINIVAIEPDDPDGPANPPIGFGDTKRLYLPDFPDLPATPEPDPEDCMGKDVSDVPGPCLRRNSLSPTLIPRAIITYWHGPSGYGLRAVQQNPQVGTSDPHDYFTFSLDSDVKIEVYDRDDVRLYEKEIEDLGTILRITVRSVHFEGQHDHIEGHDPPTGVGD